MTKTCSFASLMTSSEVRIGALNSLICESSSASKVTVSTVLLKSSRSKRKKKNERQFHRNMILLGEYKGNEGASFS